MQFFKNIYDKYLCVNLRDYENLGLNLEINKLLFFVFVGLCIASVFISINQAKISLLIKKLIRSEAFSEQAAKSLSDLGLGNDKGIKSILSKQSGVITRIVSFVGYKKPTYEEYVEAQKAKKKNKYLPKELKDNNDKNASLLLSPDFDTVSVYIDESQIDYAKHYYKTNSSSISKTIFSCVLIMVFYIAVMFLMPTLLELVNSILA